MVFTLQVRLYDDAACVIPVSSTVVSLFSLGELQERIASTVKGSITSVQAIYVPADDLTDPAPSATFEHLDASTVLARKITYIGVYPAVDPLDSSSDLLNPVSVGYVRF